MPDSINNFDIRPEDISFNLQNLNISDPGILDHKANRRRRCPIMVEFTDVKVKAVDLARALEAGMNVCKFRMAFSTKNEKEQMISRLEKAAVRCAIKKEEPICPIAVCCALKTWVKKIGIFKQEPTTFQEGAEVIVTCNKSMIEKCTESMIFLDYDNLTNLKAGQEITIGYEEDVVMHCLNKVDEMSIKCKVSKGGIVNSLETAFFRNFKNTTPYISRPDISILKFIVRYQVNILFIYYARDGEMIKKIRHLISKAKIKPLIYCGICHKEGIDNLDDIIQASDGIILCRDFLYRELPLCEEYRIPILQKWIAGKCIQAGKPMFITAVFKHVVKYGNIYDSEISDVTNALMDGVTGFILRDYNDIENTEYALNGLNDICCQVEPLTYDRKMFWRMLNEFPVPVNASEAAVLSCVAAANQTNARVVIISSVSGQTARMLLWLRPACIVIIVCERMLVAKMMYCCRNIVPIISKGDSNKKWIEIEEGRIQFAAEFAVSKQWLEYGDMYVALQRSYEGHLFCDVVKILTVTFAKKMLVECHYGSDEEKASKESFEVLKVKKKRRKKKKKVKVEKTNLEQIEEEEEKDGDKKSGVHIAFTSPKPSKMAHGSKSTKSLDEEKDEEQDEEQKDEEEQNED